MDDDVLGAPRLFDDLPGCPDLVKDETITVARGDTRYTIDMDDATVELLARGICPQEFAQRCYEMLGWKREYYRNRAREAPPVVET